MKKKKQLIKEKDSKDQKPKALPQGNSLRNNMVIGFIITYTCFLFAKSVQFMFVNWDDPSYILENSLLHDLSVKGLKEIFTTPVIGMYNPLTFLIYSLEYKVSGLDPATFHTFNILFHLCATVLAYHFIFKLTAKWETAAIVALLFAIHPMHVSVVTWVSQMKTSLCVSFYFAALIFYIKYVQDNYKLKYLYFTGLFFLLAVLSKPSAVTLTPMLFLLDYYLSRTMDRRLFLEKIPFIILSLAFGILTLYTHSGDSIYEVNTSYSLINQVLIGNYAIVFYIEKLFIPLNLSAIYPYPENTTYLHIKYYLALPVIPILFLLVYKAGKFRKEIVFGLLFFIIAISVLIRIVPSGFFSAANRYTYLSYTGLFFIIGQYISYLLDKKFTYAFKIKKYIIATLFILIVFYSYRTTIRVKTWQNTITLFDDVIKKQPKIPVAYNNRGFAKMGMGDPLGALIDFNQALSLDADYVDAYVNRGLLQYNQGNIEEAWVDYNTAIDLNPKCGPAFFNRALIKMKQNDTTGAIDDLKHAASRGVKQANKQIEKLKLKHGKP